MRESKGPAGGGAACKGKMMRCGLWLCSLALVLLIIVSQSYALPLEFYVDGIHGSDSNPGTLNEPFKTLNHARDYIRTLGTKPEGVVVSVRAGEYSFLDAPFSLGEGDSGRPNSPIIYRSYPGDKSPARLTAGVSLAPEVFHPVAPHRQHLLPEGARKTAVEVDLKKLGITDYGELQSGMLGGCANNKLELFYPNKPMHLARYPNISPQGQWQYMLVSKVVESTKTFIYNDTRISGWKNTSTLWLHGFWSFDWADNYVKVESIDTSTDSITVDANTPPVYGFKQKARYYALNILEELDTPDEYYVDRNDGILYLYEKPTETGCVSVGESVVTLNSISYVAFEGFVFDCARTIGITANGVVNITIADSVLRSSGGSSIHITGYNNTVRNVTASGNGCGGVTMSGGDQPSLTRGNNLLTQSTIYDWSRWKRTYQPGIGWSGVGNSYTKNYLHDAPHAGILGGGNDCLFEHNKLVHLCYEVSDSGAFYTGRSWIDRGNVIRHSTFQDIRTTEKLELGYPSVQAIYLDDQMSGYSIHDNQFINCQVGTFIGGGRRNQAYSNSYWNCTTAVHLDDRGLSWQKSFCVEGGTFEQQLDSVHYKQPPWSTHYPELVGIYQDHPCTPVYNVVANNTYCNTSTFIDATPDQIKEWMDTVTNNTQHC